MPILESIEAAMRALHAYVPQTVSMRENYSLDRLRAFLAEIGNPQDARPAVHIAGTSGKTSTSYFVRALLQEADRVTGLTVSPHIVSITERVQLDGAPLPDHEFLNCLGQFLEIVRASEVPLTYFEILVAFAQWVFSRSRVDYAVVETGLGGLLDGTNTMTRTDKICAITDLGLDHTEVLGNTIEEIAWQKAGIVQPGNVVFLLEQDPAAMAVVAGRVRSQGAELRVVTTLDQDRATLGLPPFQRRNWSLARAVYEHLRERDGLPLVPGATGRAATLGPPGRFECHEFGGRTLVLDGAHNPQKLAALRAALLACGLDRIAVMASLVAAPEHKLASAFQELRRIATHLIVPEFTVVQDLAKKSPPAAEMADRARRAGISSVAARPDVGSAFAALLARPEPTLLVTGSLYLVSQVRPLAIDAICSEATRTTDNN